MVLLGVAACQTTGKSGDNTTTTTTTTSADPTGPVEQAPVGIENPHGGDNLSQYLKGRWVSANDAQMSIEFDGATYRSFYNGAEKTKLAVEYHDMCPELVKGVPCFVTKDGTTTDRFIVVEQQADALRVRHDGASEEALLFKRQK
jgi:hypothetical protein